MHIQTHVFFRPPEVKREASSIHAGLFNRCRLLLGRSERDCVFVPIRSMQFLAVVSDDEVIFVDSQAYGVRDGEGGRMILLAWCIPGQAKRDALNEPVPIDVVHYAQGQGETQRRLMGDFLAAMDLMVERQQGRAPAETARVITLR
ncbi:MAG: hypothetical protein ACPGU7_04910 [Gammaproteobacteria bacterium]